MGGESGRLILKLQSAHNIRLDRVLLRVIEETDAPELLRLYSNVRVTQFLPLRLDSVEQAQALARDLRTSWSTHGFGMWAIVDLRDGSFIGRCGFFDRPSADPTMPTKELAYMLDDRVWGDGLATECARACLRYGFMVKNFDSVYAITRRENVASRRVMENLHMVHRQREPFTSLGKVFYSMNRGEYVVSPQTFDLVGYTE